MFYSQFILAKKGPLGTIWIAAHLERKLRKNQVADTDIGVSVDSILFPDVPIALRLSSHLLLGVVRIYSRKVNYLFDDCSEALLKIKQAFRSTAVDLPPEESTAPYHSITLPETFDLDDFELPDNEIFQGNYVDHHVSTREQITLQDTMEGVVYSTSQFGLDERFGDGDTSQIGLDFEEDLFLGKVAAQGNEGISDGDPQALDQSTIPQGKHEIYEGIPGPSETMQINGIESQNEIVAGNTDFVTYAQAPSTPGLFEEPNLSGVQEPMACNDHLDLEDHNLSNLAPIDSAKNPCSVPSPHCGDDSTMVFIEENGYCLGDMNVKQAKMQEHVQSRPISPVLECNGTVGALDGPNRVEDVHNGVVINNESIMPFLDKKHVEHAGVRLDETVASPSCSQVTSELEDPARKICSSNSCARVSEDCLEDQQTSLRPEIQNDDFGIGNKMGESCMPNITESFNYVDHKEMASAEVPLLRACSSLLSHCATVSYPDKIMEVSCNLPSDIVGPSSLDNAKSFDNQFENLDRSATSDLPAPEKFLSVPEGFTSKPSDFLVESTPEKEVIGGNAGIKLISGKKRSSTESRLTMQSLNSTESFGEARGKITAESVPHDDDLLSSILVGRRSSVLKLKPTPTALEIISTKRSRTAPRGTASKRKVLMDDTMVLHGDTIRQQLTNTEDIRRVRKKAPCTRPEISLIQREFLEDDIFTEPIFTGLSAELIFLHTETFDLSRTKVSENDVDNASEELRKDVGSSVRLDVTQGIEPLQSTEPLIVRDDAETQLADVPIEKENKKAENHDQRSRDAGSQEQGIADREEFNTSKHEPLEEITDMEIDKGNFEVTDPVFEDFFNASADVNIQSRLEDKTGNENASLQMDALCMSPDKKLDAQPKEADASIVEASIQNGVDIEVVEHNVDVGADFSESTGIVNATPVTAFFETGECKNLSFSNDQAVEEIGNNEQHIVNETEVPDTNLGYGDKYLKSTRIHDEGGTTASLNGKENLGCLDANPQSGIDAEVAVGYPIDHGDFEDVFGNDTDFLNVDDDEIAEDVDDMPCAEDTRLLENSGWSSRTRAVAKYLQTQFDNETVHGKRVLGMDGLLNGKTRKEASRMFFETLVLKTRDYIHVEQAKPFDNVNIRPRVKIMKSDF